MKLYLNDKQRNLILEILRASEHNAINGNDSELAIAFGELYKQIEPTNAECVILNRTDAETIVEFCDIVRKSLDNALNFLEKDSTRDADQIAELKKEATEARDEIEDVTNQLQNKIRKNPIK